MITIQRTEIELLREFRHVHSLAYDLHYRKTFRIFLILVFVSLLLTAFVWFFADKDTMVILKGMTFILTPLILVVALAYFAWFAYQRSKAWNWCKSAAKQAIDSGEVHTIIFSDKGLIAEAKNYRTELQWDYFNYYDEDATTLYLFPAKESLYSCWSFSKEEIGNEAVAQMKILARTRLQKLTAKNSG